MPYLMVVVLETMRIRPVAYFGAVHRCIAETEVCGASPKDSAILVNVYKLALDSKLWHNPTEFRPERFLEEEKNIDLRLASWIQSTLKRP
jgi:cytochrome P450